MRKRKVKELVSAMMAAGMAMSILIGCGSSSNETASASNPAAEVSDSSESTSASGGKIKVSIGISADNQPYSYMDADESYAGYEYEVLLACADKLSDKYDFEITMDEWTNLLVGIDTGTYDFAAGSFGMTDERKEKYVYAQEACLWDTPFHVAYLAGRTDITDMASMAGMTIATTPGLMAEQLIVAWNDANPDKQILIEYPDGYETIYSGMVNGLYDGYIGTSIELNSFNSRFDSFMDIGDVDLSSDEGETGVYFIYSKDNAELAADMDTVLAEMRADGTLGEICTKEIGDDFTKKQ